MRPPSLARRAGLLAGAIVFSALVVPAQVTQFRALPRLPFPSILSQAFKVVADDFNRDRLPDLAIATLGSQQNLLFFNDGLGGFVDVTATQLPVLNDSTGAVATGDIDRDGDLDLFFGNLASELSRLYVNDGAGKFTDVTATQLPALGITVYATAFVDVDRDQDLDLVARGRLLLNNGMGTFTDVTSTHMPAVTNNSWGMAVGDVDGDGDPDLVYGASSSQPQLYLNDGTGKYNDFTANLPSGNVDMRGTLGLGDLDGDRDLDLFLPNYGLPGPNVLWLNNGMGMFTDASANLPAGDYREYGAALADLDLDGDLDIVTAHWGTANNPEQNRLYLNNGRAVFTDVTAARAPAILDGTVCLAIADMDLDGDPDVCFGNWVTLSSLVWWNHHRHVAADTAPMVGQTYNLDFYGLPGYATAPQAMIGVFGLRQLAPPLAIPPYGYLGITPALVLPGLSLLPPGGKVTAPIPVPNDPFLRGLGIHWQAIATQIPEGPRLTNAFKDTVQ